MAGRRRERSGKKRRGLGDPVVQDTQHIELEGAEQAVALIGSVLAFTAYVWLLQNAPVSQVPTYAYINPVVAVLLGALLLDEKMTATTSFGGAIILLASRP